MVLYASSQLPSCRVLFFTHRPLPLPGYQENRVVIMTQPAGRRSHRIAGLLMTLDFFADWCVSCKQMEPHTFTDFQVFAVLHGT
jgi:thiol-disulfide isomerase/thioredoxin